MDHREASDKATAARAAYAASAAQIIRLRAAAEAHFAARWDSNPLESNDCTVRALELTTKLSYREAHALMARHGRQLGKGAHIDGAIAELGGQRVYEQWYTPRCKTVAAIAREYPKGFYIVRIRGHVFAMVDGKQIDAALNGPRAKVRAVWAMPDPTDGA